jgi:hypothetical protein
VLLAKEVARQGIVASVGKGELSAYALAVQFRWTEFSIITAGSDENC